jgi:hypothetical protein
LHHAVANAGDLKRADLALPLWYVYPAVRLGLVPASEKVVSYLRKRSVEPRRLDGFKRLPIKTGRAPVSFGDVIGLLQSSIFAICTKIP